jgi:hypothetical protein
MGRLVRIDPATEEKNSQAAVVATGAHGRLVRTGDVQRTSPAGNTVKLPSRETERADELDKRTTPSKSRQGQNRSFGERLAKAAGSGLVAEGANLANLGGVAADRRGGTEMSDVYRRQAETLDKQIAALEKTLKDPTMTAQDIRETNEALAIARSEREKYGKVIESGEKTAGSLYDTADKGYSLAEKWGEESTAGTKGIEKGALKIIPAATQIGLQVAERAIAPGLDVAGRALSAAGANAADYRHKAGEQYDKEKAALRATVSALGVAAGGALSKGVNAAGLKLLRAAGKQNHILPNVLLGGANAVGYAAGETGASELSKAMTEENYTPDWDAIGQTAMTAFAFGAITSAINAAAMTGRNKRYMNELNDAVKERYDYAKRIIEDPRATAGQKAAGAESVMNAADKMRGALDELQVVGAQKEVDAMREFLLSIYGEMMPYTGAGSAGAGTAGIAPVTPGGGIMTVRPGEGTNSMQEAAPPAPITPRAAGAAAAAQNTMPAQPAAVQEGAQGAGEGNLVPAQSNVVQGAQEAKADALDAGGRVPLDQYATPENAQQVSQEINDGTLAVDSHNKIYRVDAGEHIDRRDSASVGERSVNAFQFDHPELHQYFAEAAADLSEEMSFAQRGGELVRRTSHEAGDDEYIRTKRGVSERIARLLDDEGVRYDDIDRSIEAIIHNHGQENFAAAKRVELLLDEMLTNGYTDIHGRYVAPNERYIEAKRAIPGADTSARTREELPLWDMKEGKDGGVYGQTKEQNHAGGAEFAEAGGQRADAVAAEGDLYRGDGRRGAAEPGAGGAGQLRKGAKGEEYRKVVEQRRKIAVLEPVTSAQELGVPGGTENQTLHVLPEEAWDDELREFAAWARERGVQHVTMVTGLLQVNTEHGAVGVRGTINRSSGEMVLRVDPDRKASASEIGKHEIGHLITEEADVRAFMEEVKRGGNWRGIYEVYERCYEPLTGGYIGMTAAERELYVWEEIMEDAYAGLDSYGQRASLYHEQAVGLLDRAPEAPTRTVSEPENVRLRAVDEPKGRGPPERFSYAGRDARNADLEALHEAERYEMQNVDAETIRQKTGWFRGADGKWRWEIDDSDAETDTKWGFLRNPDAKRYNELFEKAYLYDTATAEDLNELQILDKNLKGVRKSPLYLDEIVRHDKLFEAYPALRDVKVRFEANTGGSEGAYHSGFNEIVLRAGLKLEPEKLKDTLVHEIQHAIQSTESFSGGSSPEYWARRDYESGDMIETRLQKNKNSILRALGKDEANKYARYTELERELGKLFLADENSEDGKRYNKLEAEQDAIYEELYPNEWFKSLLDIDRKMENPSEVYTDLYRNTAGEIEARDAAARRGLTAEERRGRKPDTGDENTVFADSGKSYSIRNTKDIPYQKQIDAFYGGDSKTVGRSDDIYIAGADNSLSALGIGEKPFFMLKSNLRKSTRIAGNNPSNSAHGISESVIRKLPELIKSPALIVQGDGRISIIPGITVKTEKNNTAPLLIAVNPNGSVDGIDAYEIKSIYGRENFANWLDLRARDSKIIAGDEKKAAALLRDVGKQYPEPVAYAADLTDAILSQSKGDVKYSAFNEEVARQLAGEERGKVKFSAEDEGDGRYLTGLDDRSIEERKKSISLDEAINELYRQKGLSYRFYSSDDPMSRAGYAMFADEPDRAGSGYGGDEKRAFSVEESSLTDISDIKEKIIEARHNTDENTPWELEDYEDVSDDSFAELFDPEDIVDSAAAYDDESLVSWLWNNVLEPNDIAGVKTSDGAVAFSPDIIKRNLAAEIAFGRSNGDDVRFSAEDEGDEWSRELERMPESVQEAVRRVKDERSKKPNMQEFPNLDAYLSGRSAQQAAEKAERLRNRGKDEFGGTKALEKLGVKIENSAGDYSVVDQLIANDQAAKIIQRETRKAIKRLGATPKEQNFARNIASGLYDEEDIPATMNHGKVMQLADYYSAEKSMSTDLIKERRREISERLQEKMEDLFDEHFEGEFTAAKRGKGIAPESGLALYHRTPQRSMRAIFGWDRGQQINEAIFEPVYVNEQERKRFVNRMHDEVRTFKGADGEDAALTQRERALAQLMIEGKAVEEMVGKSEIKQQIIHAAENLLDGAEMTDAAREFGLHGKEERELAQRYADWLETKRELDSGSVDKARVENAAKKYSGLYDEFYAAINDFLVAHGYEPIGFIKGYAPHFQPEAESNKLESALKAIGVDLGAEVGKLPASIAGLTKEFKPNKRYNPFFQHRKGTSTDYDIQKGFEKYIDYLSDVLYHTDDVMRVRAAAKYFRRKYAPDDISALIEQAEDLKFATPEEKELFLKTNGIVDDDVKLSYQAMNRAMEQYTEDLFNDVTQTTKYGDLVTWLDDYGNKLAGKQLFNDRSMEREVGRMSLNVGRKLVSTFARANVAGNLSSSLNQTAQLPLIAGELGPKYVAEAIGDIASGKAKGDFADRSDFLTEKRGIRYLTNTKGDKITTALFWPLERMDYLMSTIAVRGRYRKELAEGKSEKEALRAADRWGRDVMGSRSKGTAPLTFQSKNLISQMVNLFQVEALNSWEHVSQDIFGPGLREMEAKLGKKEASRRLAGIIVGTLLGAFLLNRVDEELYGGTPAQFDVLGLLAGFLASGNGLTTNEQLGVWFDDVWQKMTGERLFGTDENAGNDKFNLAAAAEDTLYNISNDVPYVRNVSGLLGVGDQTLPMPDLYGTAKGIGGAFADAAEGDMLSFSEEIARQLIGLAGDTLPGGRQAEKTAQGIEAVARGGSYKGSGDSKRLQYPVESPLEDPWTALRAAIFGKNALPESRTYWAAGGKALSAAQTRLYEDLVDSGLSRKRAYEILKRFNDATADLEADRDKNGNPIGGSKKEKIVKEINKLPLSRRQKNMLYLSRGYSEKDLNSLPWN